MRTIFMGLNTAPVYAWIDDLVKSIPDADEATNFERKARLHTEAIKSSQLKEQIVDAVEADGAVKLSWSCEGLTRHQMHSLQWAQAMAEYDFEIEGFTTIVRKRA